MRLPIKTGGPIVRPDTWPSKNIWPIEPRNGPLDWPESGAPLSNIAVSRNVMWNGRPSWLFKLGTWQYMRSAPEPIISASTWYIWSHYLWPVGSTYAPTLYALDQDGNTLGSMGQGSKPAGEWSRCYLTFQTGAGDTAIKLQHDGQDPGNTFHIAGMMVEYSRTQETLDDPTPWVSYQVFNQGIPRYHLPGPPRYTRIWRPR